MRPPDTALPASTPAWVTVAQLLGAWGLRGQVKALPTTASAARLAPGSTVYLDGQPRRIQAAQPQAKWVALSLEGVETRGQAEALRGQELQVPAAWLAPLPEGTYYHYQIIGLQAFTTQGELLGTVAEILETGSNDVYVVRGQGRELLIPALDSVISQVDLPGGRLVVEPLPGLLD